MRPGNALTPNELLLNEARTLRKDGKLRDALVVLDVLFASLTTLDLEVLGHAHVQAGIINALLEDFVPAEHHLRLATHFRPRKMLVSLGLFHALLRLDRRPEALKEMIRFLAMGGVCDDYPTLLAADDFCADLTVDERELAATARQLLARRAGPAPIS